MASRIIPGLAWQEHPDSNRVTPPAQRGVAQPPSKWKSHVKWFLACLVAVGLVVAIALVLYFTLPTALPAILVGSIGGSIASIGGLIRWGIKGYQLGLAWTKYKIWQEMLKNMEPTQQFELHPRVQSDWHPGNVAQDMPKRVIAPLTQALTDIKDFIFGTGDKRTLEKSYEHFEILCALRNTRHGGFNGFSFVRKKLEYFYAESLLEKLSLLNHRLEWADSAPDESRKATRKSICRVVLEPLLTGNFTGEWKFTNEHLIDGVLELPYYRWDPYHSLKELIKGTGKKPKIDLSACSNFTHFTQQAYDFIVAIPNGYWQRDYGINTTVGFPAHLTDVGLASVSNYVIKFSALPYPVGVELYQWSKPKIERIIRQYKREQNIGIQADFIRDFANPKGLQGRGCCDTYKVHFVDGSTIALNYIDHQALHKALPCINAIETSRADYLSGDVKLRKGGNDIKKKFKTCLQEFCVEFPKEGAEPFDATRLRTWCAKELKERQSELLLGRVSECIHAAKQSFTVPQDVNKLPPFFFAMTHVSGAPSKAWLNLLLERR